MTDKPDGRIVDAVADDLAECSFRWGHKWTPAFCAALAERVSTVVIDVTTTIAPKPSKPLEWADVRYEIIGKVIGRIPGFRHCEYWIETEFGKIGPFQSRKAARDSLAIIQ